MVWPRNDQTVKYKLVIFLSWQNYRNPMYQSNCTTNQANGDAACARIFRVLYSKQTDSLESKETKQKNCRHLKMMEMLRVYVPSGPCCRWREVHCHKIEPTVNWLCAKWRCVSDISAGRKKPALMPAITLCDKSKTLIFEWYAADPVWWHKFIAIHHRPHTHKQRQTFCFFFHA